MRSSHRKFRTLVHFSPWIHTSCFWCPAQNVLLMTSNQFTHKCFASGNFHFVMMRVHIKFGHSKIQDAKQNDCFILIINIYTFGYTFKYYRLAKIMGIQWIPSKTKWARPYADIKKSNQRRYVGSTAASSHFRTPFQFIRFVQHVLNERLYLHC